jgi:hypothetical protein
MRERELSFEDRAKWGECPVCHAKDGEACNGHVGILLGRTVSGEPPADGAHLGRLQRAPFVVREVPVR